MVLENEQVLFRSFSRCGYRTSHASRILTLGEGDHLKKNDERLGRLLGKDYLLFFPDEVFPINLLFYPQHLRNWRPQSNPLLSILSLIKVRWFPWCGSTTAQFLCRLSKVLPVWCWLAVLHHIFIGCPEEFVSPHCTHSRKIRLLLGRLSV